MEIDIFCLFVYYLSFYIFSSVFFFVFHLLYCNPFSTFTTTSNLIPFFPSGSPFFIRLYTTIHLSSDPRFPGDEIPRSSGSNARRPSVRLTTPADQRQIGFKLAKRPRRSRFRDSGTLFFPFFYL